MQYTTIGNHIVVDIHKPLGIQPTYDFVRVRKTYFDKACKTSRYVLVRTPNGEKVFFPKAMKKAKVVKESFLYPDDPMEMYELSIPHCTKKDNEAYMF